MKILMLTPYLPYPDSSGGQIRTQNLLKHLKSDHDITLFSLIKDPKEKQYIPILEKDFCKKVKVFLRSQKPFTFKNVINTAFSLKPFLVVRNFSSDAKKAIEQELQKGDYDLIHVETFYAMPHIPETDIPVVLVDQTIEYKVYQHYTEKTALWPLKPLMYLDVAKLKHWERHYWQKADRAIAVSSQDKQQMLELEPDLDVNIVPNGVNLDLFKKKTNWETDMPKLLFIGNFHWLQNTEAAKFLINKVLPQVKKDLPKAQVHIVGQHQPDDLKELSSESVIIDELAEDDVQGIVDAYHNSDVFVAPLFGPGGTRLKTLAAMASQLPIVSSAVGISGLGIEEDEHALVSEDPKKMAQYVVQLIKNPQQAEEMAKKSRSYVEKEYSYKSIANKLSNIYQKVANV